MEKMVCNLFSDSYTLWNPLCPTVCLLVTIIPAFTLM